MSKLKQTIAFIENEWLPALRSGDYAQGYESLSDHSDETERYCCLGVACDLADDSLWHSDSGVEYGWGRHDLMDDEEGGSTDVSELLYISQFPLSVLTRQQIADIAIMNDTRDHDFIDMAKHIEEDILPGLKEKLL